MSLVPVTERVVHSALEERVGTPPGSAALTDRQRMAVLLQGSALLGHLSRAGWCLEGGWEDARIDGRAALGSVRAMPGRSRDLVQDEIRRLLVLLFEGAGARPAGGSGTMVERREVRTRTCGRRLAGRGHARRLARRLLHVCDQRLSPMRADRIVEYLLDKAEFLWLPEYASAREALVAEHRTVGGRRSTVVGRWSFAARLRSSASNLVGLRRELRTERARDHWLGEVDGRDPVDLVESGGTAKPSRAGAASRRPAGRSASSWPGRSSIWPGTKRPSPSCPT